ncbi:MAG: SusC/RagA family TonB-linked outer membrane protein [Longimicrobiales bacterium]
MSRRRYILALAVAAWSTPFAVSGQNTTVTGTVRSETQAAVRGAFVQIPSLNLSTVTNDNGIYSIVIPAARATGTVTMTISSIGFKPVEFQVALRAGRVAQDAIMAEQAIPLNDLVVTGTAGRQERRAQAAVVATISAPKVAEFAPIQSVENLLQARTPGVMVRNTSGSTGTASTIRIRGQASIELGNDPLVFIDGIRADGGRRELGVSTQDGSALNDVKIEDIESIEIVKGPAAATLYGADANAGVINIITKRGRQGSGFTQSVTVAYGEADPNFSPPNNYQTCTAGLSATTFPACVGQPVGTVLGPDNPLLREKSFRDAVGRSFGYSLRGGGERYGVFLSLGLDNEAGTLPNNEFGHTSGRASFDFFASEKLRLELGFAMIRTATQLPNNDNDIYGYLGGGLLGDPRTLGAAKDGWYGNNRQTTALSSLENTDRTMRVQPRVAVNYQPFSWFNNRFTAGADVQRGRRWNFRAKNDEGWFDNVLQNTGQIGEIRNVDDRYTFDYLGNLTRSFNDDLRADLSFGSQAIIRLTDQANATGQGLVNNKVRTVNSAARVLTGGQTNTQTRQIGFFAQTQISFREKLFLQLGGRVDQGSSFGAQSKPFYSPKVGVSYVISEEPYFRSLLSEDIVSTLRLRAAFGVTGRTPDNGARSTFNPTVNQISATGTVVGVTPDDVGNPDIRAEKGQELEAGFEAGLFNDRLGLDFTYFNKKTIDLILERPVPPSMGAAEPLVNLGSMLNRGLEIAANARVLTHQKVALELRGAVNTLHNEVLDLGDSPEDIGRKVGFPINGNWDYVIKSVDLANNRVIVSDDFEFIGNGPTLPGWETTFSGTLTLFQNLSFYAQMDGRGDVTLFNSTDEFRDRQIPVSADAHLKCAAIGTNADGTCTDAGRTRYMRKFGPFFTEDGAPVPGPDVTYAWMEDSGFFKLREASVSYRVPREFVNRFMRAQSAQLTLSMRNLHTWTDFTGLDPETNQFLTVPADRRWMVRFNFTF